MNTKNHSNEAKQYIISKESHALMQKKRSLKLSQEIQEEVLLYSTVKKERDGIVKKLENEFNQEGNYVLEKNRAAEFNQDKVEEIGYLLQKMFEAMNYDKKDLEKLLFDKLDFSDTNFHEKLAQRIIDPLHMYVLFYKYIINIYFIIYHNF